MPTLKRKFAGFTQAHRAQGFGMQCVIVGSQGNGYSPVNPGALTTL
ncbi:MAG: hypothetical protein IT521_04930 [Burkholderiales bacterium]|nr:hypothetical protein [Burkholderiales bacterium]